MNTTENNKLIAEFMGIKFKDDELYLKELREMKANGVFFEQGYMSSELKYYTSWNWLMPVVEKIKDEAYSGIILEKVDEIDNVLTCDLRKENLYNAVVEFIKQYNENERLNNEYISYNDAPYGQD